MTLVKQNMKTKYQKFYNKNLVKESYYRQKIA